MEKQLIELLKSDFKIPEDKKEKLQILGWAERNLDVSIPLFKEYQPDYTYEDRNGDWLIKGCTLVLELKLNNI